MSIFGLGPRVLPSSLFTQEIAARSIIRKLEKGNAIIMKYEADVEYIQSLMSPDWNEYLEVEEVSNGYLIYLDAS